VVKLVNIKITRKTIKRAKTAGVIALAAITLGTIGYFIATSRAGKMLVSYSNAVKESVGLEGRVPEDDQIDAEINRSADNVEEFYERNINRMGQGRGELYPFTMHERLTGIEDTFLEHGRRESKSEYLTERLDPARLEQLLEIYGENASSAESVDLAVSIYQTAEGYVVEELDDLNRNAHYVERIMYGIENDLLNEDGKEAILTTLYGDMDSEEIAATCSHYSVDTPGSRRETVETIFESMSDQERTVILSQYVQGLPDEEYEALMRSTPRYTSVVAQQQTNGISEDSNGAADRDIDVIRRVEQYLDRAN